jgi:autotransporter-associated beta strand protein
VNGGLGNRSADGGGNVGILFRGGTLQYTGSTAQSTNRAIRLSIYGGGTIDASGTSPSATLSFTATSSPDFFEGPGNRTLTLTGTNTGDNTFAMPISEAGGATSLVKSGAGTWVLTGASTHTGATSVNEGTLKVNGSTAGSAVTVASGATLGGTGTVGGATTIQSGGHLAVGNSAGTQTFSSTLAFDSGSIFDWELDASTTDPGANTANSGTYDKVVANGAVTGTSVFTIALLGADAFTDAFWDTNKSWSDIFTGTGSFDLSTLFTTFGGTGVSSAGLVSGQGQFSFTSNTLNWTAVPEPTSAIAGLLLTAGLLRRRRKF